MNSKYSILSKLQQKPTFTKGWLFVILVLIFIPQWFYLYYHYAASIAPDLLLRTIGSRLQREHLPIYNYQWKVGDPITLLNPYPDLRVGVNGVVSTPFFLWMLQPFAQLNYCSIKLWWIIIQELFLFATLWFSCRSFTRIGRQILFLTVASIFFVYSRNWWLHLYNGQLYVMYAFAFAFAGYAIPKFKSGFTTVVLFLLLSAIRPFFVVATLPLIKLNKRWVIGLSLAAIFIATIVALATSKNEWQQYNAAMKIYASEQSNEISYVQPTTLNLAKADPCTINPVPEFKNFKAGCLFSFQHYLQLFKISISSAVFYQSVLLVCILAVMFFAYRKRLFNSTSAQLIIAFLLYQLCELIAPASRNPYNMIQWLPAVAWLFVWGDKKIIILTLIGLCLNHDLPFRFAYQREIGEGLLLVAVALFLFAKPKSDTAISA